MFIFSSDEFAKITAIIMRKITTHLKQRRTFLEFTESGKSSKSHKSLEDGLGSIQRPCLLPGTWWLSGKILVW